MQLAGFAAAGPTTASRDFIDDPHAPFAVSGSEIRKHTALKKTVVINDFEALGLGIEAIDRSQITTLLEGTPREHGTKLIIGAGSGLGSGLMLWNEKINRYLPSPLNYSFVDFSPQSELELAYNEYLKENANNAWGKVLGSSFGIVGIYNFLHRPETSPYQYADYLEIFNQRTQDPACKAATDMFMKLYLRLLRTAVYAQAPYAGLYITNSIAEQHPSLFTDPAFKTEFLNTGDLANAGNAYLRNYLQQIPVYLVASPDLKLYGAAQYMVIEQKKPKTSCNRQ
jgi:glucokinase